MRLQKKSALKLSKRFLNISARILAMELLRLKRLRKAKRRGLSGATKVKGRGLANAIEAKR